MDNFNVPKKVNRHVLKALHLLCLDASDFKQGISTSQIIYQVKYQMKNLVPVQDIDSAILKSLKNMTEVGLVQKLGQQRYCIGRCFQTGLQYQRAKIAAAAKFGNSPRGPNNGNTVAPERRFFRGGNPQQHSRSALDPNLKRAHHSEDSLSGDEFDRTRKRLRTNTKNVRHAGRKMELPRARQHKTVAKRGGGRATKNVLAMWKNQNFGCSEPEIELPLCKPVFCAATTSTTSTTFKSFPRLERSSDTDAACKVRLQKIGAARYKMSSQPGESSFDSAIFDASTTANTSKSAAQPQLDLESPFTSNLEFMLANVTPAESRTLPCLADIVSNSDSDGELNNVFEVRKIKRNVSNTNTAGSVVGLNAFATTNYGDYQAKDLQLRATNSNTFANVIEVHSSDSHSVLPASTESQCSNHTKTTTSYADADSTPRRKLYTTPVVCLLPICSETLAAIKVEKDNVEQNRSESRLYASTESKDIKVEKSY